MTSISERSETDSVLREILRDVLGLSAGEIAQLAADGVIGTTATSKKSKRRPPRAVHRLIESGGIPLSSGL